MRAAERKTFADALYADRRGRQHAPAGRGNGQRRTLEIAEQLAGIGVLRRAHHIAGRALFLNFTVAKDQQSVGAFRRQRQIVGHEQHRRAGLPAQRIQQVEDPFLYRHVEGAGGLIGND